MTVQAQNSTQYYDGPIVVGTVLSINEFTFIDNSHVSAKIRGEEVIWKYGTDYTVSGANSTVRTLTVLKEVPANSVLAVYLDVPITQNIAPEEGGNFPASTNEFVLDKLTYICQMLYERIARSLQVSIDTPFTGTLPAPEPNKALKMNSTGTGFVMSDYDPDQVTKITENFKDQAQAAATAAAASQTASATSASFAADSATQAEVTVQNGITSIQNTVTSGEGAISLIGDNAVEEINEAIDGLKSYLNSNPFSGKSIGEFFWTFRIDEINGAYECNAQEFLASTFSGDNNPYDLLVAGKLPVKTYEEYQQELEDNNGVCGYFGLDTVNQKFKLPKIDEVFIEAGDLSTLGQYLKAKLPNISGGEFNTLAGDTVGCFNESEIVGTASIPTGAFQQKKIRFNASGSSTIYSNNCDTVQPPAIKLRPMVQLASAATEVSFADYATQFTAALNQAINSITATGQAYLQELTPNQFVKFSNRRRIKIAANTFLRLDVASTNKTLWYVNLEEQEIEAESLLDEGSTFQAGKNYALYLVPNAAGTGVELKVSLNQTAPTGYSPLDTRRIAGWHTECKDVGNVTWYTGHPLSGWLAGDILPKSVWTLYHRPYAPPAAGVVYVECGRPFWRTIYDHSGTLETTNFEYGGTITRSRDFYGHFKDMEAVGFSLPTYEQVAVSGIGCEELKAVMGKAESSVVTAGGHVNESNHRITSREGAEDCVGCTWKPTTIAAIGGSGWSISASGVHQYGSVQLLPVGGYWVDSGNAGPFATSGNLSALTTSSLVASFGISYPLPRKSIGMEK